MGGRKAPRKEGSSKKARAGAGAGAGAEEVWKGWEAWGAAEEGTVLGWSCEGFWVAFEAALSGSANPLGMSLSPRNCVSTSPTLKTFLDRSIIHFVRSEERERTTLMEDG